jgi:hypothetical protein
MRKKGLASLYKEALKTSQEELQRLSAMEALRQFDNLDLTLGEFVADLKMDWKTFRKLPLTDVLDALGTSAAKKPSGKPGRPPGSKTTKVSKRFPKRLTKHISAKYTESIQAYLADHPDSKTKVIAASVGLASKQAASLLGKLRAAKLVTTTGKAAGMRYTLKAAAPKKAAAPRKPAAPKKPALRKKATKKKTARKKTAKKKTTKK